MDNNLPGNLEKSSAIDAAEADLRKNFLLSDIDKAIDALRTCVEILADEDTEADTKEYMAMEANGHIDRITDLIDCCTEARP